MHIIKMWYRLQEVNGDLFYSLRCLRDLLKPKTISNTIFFLLLHIIFLKLNFRFLIYSYIFSIVSDWAILLNFHCNNLLLNKNTYKSFLFNHFFEMWPLNSSKLATLPNTLQTIAFINKGHDYNDPVVRVNLTRATSALSSTPWRFSSYLLSHLIFYLPRCTLPDFPPVSSLSSLPFLS